MRRTTPGLEGSRAMDLTGSRRGPRFCFRDPVVSTSRQHVGERPGRLVAEGLQVLDVLQFLEAIQERFLDEVVHDDPPGPAHFIEHLLESRIDTRADLHGGHSCLIANDII